MGFSYAFIIIVIIFSVSFTGTVDMFNGKGYMDWEYHREVSRGIIPLIITITLFMISLVFLSYGLREYFKVVYVGKRTNWNNRFYKMMDLLINCKVKWIGK